MSRLYVDQILPSSTDNVTFTQGGNTTFIAPSYVGELKSFRVRRTTSRGFPFWNLSLPDQLISSVIYPDYTEYLRSIKVETCNPILLTGNVYTSGNSTTITFASSQTLPVGTILYFHTATQFRTVLSGSGTSYVIDEPITLLSQAVSIIDQSQYSSTFLGSWNNSTNFQLNDNAQNKILLDALTEDAYYSGASINANVITPINNINYIVLRSSTTDVNITSFNPTSRVITVGSAAPSGTTIELYPYRTTNSLDARHRQVDDSVLLNNGFQVVNGLRLRDRIQGHWHSGSSPVEGGGYATGEFSTASYRGGSTSVTNPISDGTNGTPRTGQFTRPRGLGVYFYEYVGRVN